MYYNHKFENLGIQIVEIEIVFFLNLIFVKKMSANIVFIKKN